MNWLFLPLICHFFIGNSYAIENDSTPFSHVMDSSEISTTHKFQQSSGNAAAMTTIYATITTTVNATATTSISNMFSEISANKDLTGTLLPSSPSAASVSSSISKESSVITERSSPNTQSLISSSSPSSTSSSLNITPSFTHVSSGSSTIIATEEITSSSDVVDISPSTSMPSLINSPSSQTNYSSPPGSASSDLPSILPSSSPTTHSVISTSSVKPTSSLQPTPVTTNPTNPTSSSTPTTTSSTRPPTSHTIKLSETNILLVKEQDDMFVEFSGADNENLDGLYLTIRDANINDDSAGVLQSLKLTGSLNSQGMLVVDKKQNLNLKNVNFSSVVIALYTDKLHSLNITQDSLLESLVLSVDPDLIASEVAEVYQPGTGDHIYVNSSMLGVTSDISMSLCNESQANGGFVLMKASKNQPNVCALKVQHLFQMKLTLHVGKKNCLSSHFPNHFESKLSKELVTVVNGHQQCGLTITNIEDMTNQARCIDGDKVVAVNFNVKSAFDEQVLCIKVGYESLTAQKSSIHIDGHLYSVSNCLDQCFPYVNPSSDNDDNKIKVTVAVVISCIGIFLVILMAVIIYMKRKKRGLLQFRMTRLDEDDDDLVGDMDDFVGNQGATFSNFR